MVFKDIKVSSIKTSMFYQMIFSQVILQMASKVDSFLKTHSQKDILFYVSLPLAFKYRANSVKSFLFLFYHLSLYQPNFFYPLYIILTSMCHSIQSIFKRLILATTSGTLATAQQQPSNLPRYPNNHIGATWQHPT